MSKQILLNKTYRHYKGNIYKVIALGRHSETGEDMVIYRSIDNGDVWCRPLNMWFDKINDQMTRFTLID